MKTRPESKASTFARRRRLPVTALALSTMLITGCFSSVRLPQAPKYWVRHAEVPMDTVQGRESLRKLHNGEFGTVLRTDWAKLQVKDKDLSVHFPERCVGVVSIPRTQEETVDYRGGWKATTGLWGFLTGVPLAVAGGIYMSRAGDAPTDAMVNGNPNITASHTREEMQSTGTTLASAGAALTVAASVSLLLRYWTEVEKVGQEVWYGLRDRTCDGAIGALKLTATTRTGKLHLHGLGDNSSSEVTLAASVDPEGTIGLPAGNEAGDKTSADWVRHVLEGRTSIHLDTAVTTLDTPTAEQVIWDIQSILGIQEEGDDDVRASLARLLAGRGVLVNSGDAVTLSVGKEGFALKLQAYAKLADASEPIATALASTLGDGAVSEGAVLRSTYPVTPNQLEIWLGKVKLPGRVDTARGDKGLIDVSASYPLDSAPWISTLAHRGSAGARPALTLSGTDAAWTIPEAVLSPARVAFLSELAKSLKDLRPDTLTVEDSDFDPNSRLERQLPRVVAGRAALCVPEEHDDKNADIKASPPPDIAEACAALEKRWSEKVAAYGKKLRGSMPKIVNAAYKQVSAEYDPEQGIDEDTDADEVADSHCTEFIGSYEDIVCGKEAMLPSSSACSTVRSCHSKMKSKVKSTISKIRSARLAEEARVRRAERAAECADRKCPHFSSCEYDFDVWGNITAYTASCGYMIRPCKSVRGANAALQCMQRKWEGCKRSCGVRD